MAAGSLSAAGAKEAIDTPRCLSEKPKALMGSVVRRSEASAPTEGRTPRNAPAAWARWASTAARAPRLAKAARSARCRASARVSRAAGSGTWASAGTAPARAAARSNRRIIWEVGGEEVLRLVRHRDATRRRSYGLLYIY